MHSCFDKLKYWIAIVSTGVSLADYPKFQTESETLILPSLFPILDTNSLSLGAANIADIGNPGNAWVNPAGLQVTGFSLAVETGRYWKSEWLYDLLLEGHPLYPAYACFSQQIAGHAYAIGYGRYYSMNLAMLGTLISMEHPEGKTEKVSIMNVDVHTLFCSTSRRLGKDSRIGLTLGLNYLKHEDRILSASANSHGFGYTFTLGTLFPVTDELSFAFTFRLASEIHYRLKLENEQSITVIDDDPTIEGNNENIQAAMSQDFYQFFAQFPWSFGTGLRYNPIKCVTLFSKIEFTKWSRLKRDANMFADKIQIHMGGQFIVSKWLDLNIGFFTHESPCHIGDGILNAELLNQNFLTAGMALRLNRHFHLNCAIMDGHWLTKNPHHGETDNPIDVYQTYLTTGFKFQF